MRFARIRQLQMLFLVTRPELLINLPLNRSAVPALHNGDGAGMDAGSWYRLWLVMQSQSRLAAHLVQSLAYRAQEPAFSKATLKSATVSRPKERTITLK